MRNSKLIFSAVVAISAIVGIGGASAADLPARTYTKAPAMVDPSYNWSGWYAGVNVGGDWRNDRWNYAFDPGSHISVLADAALIGATGTGSPNRGSFIGGGQVGYNWQAAGSKWVVGVEADISGISSQNFTGAGVISTGQSFAITQSDRTNWLATFRGRLGYAWDRSLLYVTGGLAVADLRLSSTYNDTLFAATGTGARSGVRAGFAVGAGWEQAVAQNWSVKVEYLYTQFDRVGGFDYTVTSTTGGTNAAHVSDQLSDNIVRVGLNYKFGG